MKHIIFVSLSIFLTLGSVLTISRSNLKQSLNDTTESVAYGLGSTGGFTLRDPSNYHTPEIVRSIVGNQRWARNVNNKETIEEVPSVADYYDGSNNLNNVRVDCAIHRDQNDCLMSSHCGWCGSKKCCVEGTAAGPVQPCDRTSYIFNRRDTLIKTGTIHGLVEKPVNIQMIPERSN